MSKGEGKEEEEEKIERSQLCARRRKEDKGRRDARKQQGRRDERKR